MTEQDPNPFDDFDRRLRDARGTASEEGDQRRGAGNYGPGLHAGIDVFAGVIGGLLIGWALDRVLGTSPVLLVVLFFAGAAAGLRNAIRTLQRVVRDENGR